jgi:uncharacterized phage protein (TIGR01671 family)
MRDIKFRVWDKDKEMYLPNDIYGIIQTDFKAFGIMIKDWENYQQGEYFYSSSQILEQYTGFKDKKEQEIYEGDIVSMQHGLYKYTVHFENGSFVCYHLEAKDLVNGGKLKWGLLSRSFELGEDYELEVIGTKQATFGQWSEY